MRCSCAFVAWQNSRSSAGVILRGGDFLALPPLVRADTPSTVGRLRVPPPPLSDLGRVRGFILFEVADERDDREDDERGVKEDEMWSSFSAILKNWSQFRQPCRWPFI